MEFKDKERIIAYPARIAHKEARLEYSAIRLQVFTVVFNPLDLLNVKPSAELDINCTYRSFAHPV